MRVGRFVLSLACIHHEPRQTDKFGFCRSRQDVVDGCVFSVECGRGFGDIQKGRPDNRKSRKRDNLRPVLLAGEKNN